MKTKSYAMTKLVWLMCLYTITGCTQETIQTPTPYDGCCGTALKVYEVEDYKVYIPNVITPNGDGINDAFYPICNKMVQGQYSISDYKIYNDTDKVIYNVSGFELETVDDWAFRGKGYERPFKPRENEKFEHIGKFKYSFILGFKKSDNTYQFIDVEGEACVVRCDEDAHVINDKNGCYFPVQGKDGMYNSSIPSNEEGCIK